MSFVEGTFINRPPMFGGMNYAFWKIRMKIFMESMSWVFGMQWLVDLLYLCRLLKMKQ